MKIGLIDVDGHNFPNIPLMKISAWHKQNGDSVEWYNPMFSGHMDKVYLATLDVPADHHDVRDFESGMDLFKVRGGVIASNGFFQQYPLILQRGLLSKLLSCHDI